MELPSSTLDMLKRDIRNHTGMNGHLRDELLVMADWWAGVRVPAIDCAALAHAQRFRAYMYFQDTIAEMMHDVDTWPLPTKQECMAWHLHQSSLHVARQLQIPATLLCDRFHQIAVRKLHNRLSDTGLTLEWPELAQDAPLKGLAFHADGSSPKISFSKEGIPDFSLRRFATTWGWVAAETESTDDLTVVAQGRGEVPYDGAAPCFWGALGHTNHAAEMVATLEVLWFLCENIADPRLVALLDKHDNTITLSYDNASGSETPGGEWSGRSEPALVLWLWRLWEIVEDAGIKLFTRRQKKSYRLGSVRVHRCVVPRKQVGGRGGRFGSQAN